MNIENPVAELQPQFSSRSANPTSWAQGREHLEKAEVYWLTTVRPDGRPHVTPMVSVWLESALYFCTEPSERKAKNPAHNSHCVITTGCNMLDNSLDLVVEGEAVRVKDEAKLRRVADSYAAKYDPPFHFSVRDGAFYRQGGEALLYQVIPTKAFGFSKGDTFSQTSWRF